ncbi:hypothetical protein D9M69_480660 [compost metagenome]
MQAAHAFPVQARHPVLEVAEHALDLVIAPLVQGQPRRARGEDVQLRGEGGEVLEAEVHAAGEGFRVVRPDRVVGLDVIHLGQLAPGQGHASRPLAVVGDQQQAGGVVVEPAADVQFVLVRLVEQVEHGAVLCVPGGADAALRLVQHEVARRLALLQRLAVQLHPAEYPHLVAPVAHRLAVHLNASRRQQEAGILAAELRQVGEEAVEAHQSCSGGRLAAQRGHRQARLRCSGGMRSSAAGSTRVSKHQHASPRRSGSAWVQRLLWPQSGQRVGSRVSVMPVGG